MDFEGSPISHLDKNTLMLTILFYQCVMLKWDLDVFLVFSKRDQNFKFPKI